MASAIYLSSLDDMARGNWSPEDDTHKVLLTTSAYTENKTAHDRRDDVTNEVTGTGYTAGGASCSVTVTKDTGNNRVDITLGGATWPTSTITARKAVYYKSRGGAASADELAAVNDFGSDVTSTGATFTLNASTYRLNGSV